MVSRVLGGTIYGLWSPWWDHIWIIGSLVGPYIAVESGILLHPYAPYEHSTGVPYHDLQRCSLS